MPQKACVYSWLHTASNNRDGIGLAPQAAHDRVPDSARRRQLAQIRRRAPGCCGRLERRGGAAVRANSAHETFAPGHLELRWQDRRRRHCSIALSPRSRLHMGIGFGHRGTLICGSECRSRPKRHTGSRNPWRQSHVGAQSRRGVAVALRSCPCSKICSASEASDRRWRVAILC
jgi:hypothetical protein